MQILNALQIKKGAKTDYTRMFSMSQPLQFIPRKEKDQEWGSWNMDWLEWHGLRQIRTNSRKLLKNYKLAEGQIDKSDYLYEPDNEFKDVVEQLSSNDEMESLELKFYPIIPNIVNTLLTEFAKRDKRVSFRAKDEYTHNEIIERKRADIENVLVKYAEARLVQEMTNQGMDFEDPEVQEQLQQKLDPQNLKTLPEIQEFYTKDYEVIGEKWASKQHAIDEERFKMDELEEEAFRDKLITDREFWHFQMFEDDYKVEVWNPVLTFYHKSPKERYISNANFVGHVEIMTAADVIDSYGWRMTEEQLQGLQQRFLSNTPGYNLGGYQNDGTFYDATKSHEWNVNRPSLEYRQLMSSKNWQQGGYDIIADILNQTEDSHFFTNSNMFRVTTGYWKSQVKIGYLTKVNESGKVETGFVSEQYDVIDKPVYNTNLIQSKTTQNLIFGEHIEWIWINQTWGGIKIGPNAPTMYGMDNALGVNPIYLGIDNNRIGPLKFQFKGDSTIYGCKLPVEGRVFSDRNTKSMSLVDKLKPFQIGYNIVNNQISDILIDEIGTVILLDQNALPQHSLGEDWGKGNLSKAYVAMKDFSMLPLDTSLSNTENALNFQHFQQLDLSQTQRLMSRIQLANFFKQQAFEQVGVSPQRMGQQVGVSQTATEVEQIQVGSYAQTEMHFVEHSDHLMPRVHQMRTDLAQHYHSTKPSITLQMLTSLDERVNFEINGEDLMLRDIHVYCTAKANVRKVLEQMKQLAISNNTMGASIYDLGKVLQADSIGGLNATLKGAEEKQMQERQTQQEHQEKLQQMENERYIQEKKMQLDHDTIEAEKDRRRDLLVAEIKASGYGSMQDMDQNNQSDFIDNMTKLKQTEQYQEQINIQRSKAGEARRQHEDKMMLKREELAVKREMKDKDLQIAATNKNKYDMPKASVKETKKSDNSK